MDKSNIDPLLEEIISSTKITRLPEEKIVGYIETAFNSRNNRAIVSLMSAFMGYFENNNYDISQLIEKSSNLMMLYSHCADILPNYKDIETAMPYSIHTLNIESPGPIRIFVTSCLY